MRFSRYKPIWSWEKKMCWIPHKWEMLSAAQLLLMRFERKCNVPLAGLFELELCLRVEPQWLQWLCQLKIFAFVNLSFGRIPAIFCIAHVPTKMLKYMELVLKMKATFMTCSESSMSLMIQSTDTMKDILSKGPVTNVSGHAFFVSKIILVIKMCLLYVRGCSKAKC